MTTTKGEFVYLGCFRRYRLIDSESLSMTHRMDREREALKQAKK